MIIHYWCLLPTGISFPLKEYTNNIPYCSFFSDDNFTNITYTLRITVGINFFDVPANALYLGITTYFNGESSSITVGRTLSLLNDTIENTKTSIYNLPLLELKEAYYIDSVNGQLKNNSYVDD